MFSPFFAYTNYQSQAQLVLASICGSQHVVDVFNNNITITNNSTNDLNETGFTLESRPETIVTVAMVDPKVENKNLLICKQETTNDVYYVSIKGWV